MPLLLEVTFHLLYLNHNRLVGVEVRIDESYAGLLAGMHVYTRPPVEVLHLRKCWRIRNVGKKPAQLAAFAAAFAAC